MKTRQMNVRGMVTASAVVSALALTVASAGCDGGADVPGDELSSETVTLISYQAESDGTVKTIEHVVPVAKVRALQNARQKQQELRRAGIEVRQGDLAYLGEVTNSRCSDYRTTWVYNKENGWNLPPGVFIGCFGAGSNGTWTGSVNLEALPVPHSTGVWASAMRSMWTSDVYRVGLEGAYKVLYGTGELIYTGYPNWRLWHQL